MVSCENMKKGEVYKCQCCDFEIEVKRACDCGTNDKCETHDATHECCEFTCCGKPLVKVKFTTSSFYFLLIQTLILSIF